MQDRPNPDITAAEARPVDPGPDPTSHASPQRPGFSEEELRAAARVIEHQVLLATARHAPKRP